MHRNDLVRNTLRPSIQYSREKKIDIHYPMRTELKICSGNHIDGIGRSPRWRPFDRYIPWNCIYSISPCSYLCLLTCNFTAIRDIFTWKLQFLANIIFDTTSILLNIYFNIIHILEITCLNSINAIENDRSAMKCFISSHEGLKSMNRLFEWSRYPKKNKTVKDNHLAIH